MVEVKDLRAVNNKKTFFLDARDEATGHNLRPVICVADIEGHILIIVPNSLISQKKTRDTMKLLSLEILNSLLEIYNNKNL